MEKKTIKIAAIIALLFTLPQLIAQNSFSEFEGYYYADGERHYWETDSTSVNIIVRNMDNYDAIVEKLALLPFASQTKIPLRLLLKISKQVNMKLCDPHFICL